MTKKQLQLTRPIFKTGNKRELIVWSKEIHQIVEDVNHEEDIMFSNMRKARLFSFAWWSQVLFKTRLKYIEKVSNVHFPA
jgi:hypothetical protein